MYEGFTINTSANVVGFGDISAHHKGRWIYSGGSDRLCYDFLYLELILNYALEDKQWVY